MRLTFLLAAFLAAFAPLSIFAQKKEDKKPVPAAANSALVFEGTELKPGKKVTLTLPLSEDGKKGLNRIKGADSYEKLKVAIALPADFKPEQSYPVIVVCATDSGAAVPLGVVDPFVTEGTKAGYVVLAAQHDGERPNDMIATEVFFSASYQAVKALSVKFPWMNTTTFVPAGHSGGGKRAGLFALLMMANDMKVSGLYMSGVSSEHISPGVATPPRGVNRAELKKLPIFVSNGSKDSYVSAANNTEVINGLTKAGFKNLKNPGHEGGHVLVQAHLKEALAWFKSLSL